MYYTMFLAPFLRGLPYEKVKQLAQMMFYELTQTYVTRGGQLVFSNIQLPMGVPDIWKNVPVVMKGRIGPDTYGSYEDEVQMFFRAITEVALEGDYWGKPFNFPKNENYVSPEFFKPEYDDLWMLVHESRGQVRGAVLRQHAPDVPRLRQRHQLLPVLRVPVREHA